MITFLEKIQDLELENKKLKQAIQNILDCWDNDHMNRLEEELNAAEELL